MDVDGLFGAVPRVTVCRPMQVWVVMWEWTEAAWSDLRGSTSYPEFGTQLPVGHTVVRLQGPASHFERVVGFVTQWLCRLGSPHEGLHERITALGEQLGAALDRPKLGRRQAVDQPMQSLSEVGFHGCSPVSDNGHGRPWILRGCLTSPFASVVAGQRSDAAEADAKHLRLPDLVRGDVGDFTSGPKAPMRKFRS